MEEGVLRKLEELQQQVAKLVERMQPTLPLTLKPKEAARLLSVSPSTIKGMLRRGEIVPTKVSGRKMIPSSEVVRIAGVKFSPAPAKAQRTPGGRKKTPRSEGRTEADRIRASNRAAAAAYRKRQKH